MTHRELAFYLNPRGAARRAILQLLAARGLLNTSIPDQHLPPGLGTIDWQDACRALNDIAYPGPVVFEGVLGPGDSVARGRFGGAQSHEELIEITLRNWRAFEALADQHA